MVEAKYVTEEQRSVYEKIFPGIVHREQFVANAFSYWASQLPMDQQHNRLRFKLIKAAYDEARHTEIVEEMARRFGGDEYMNAKYDEWDRYQNWSSQMSCVFTRGLRDHVEFLCTVPLAGDPAGLVTFQSYAACSPDPIWTDAAESIVEDEKFHSSLTAEYLPKYVEETGEEGIERIESALETWLPAVLGLQGHPIKDADKRANLIDAGVIDITIGETYDHMLSEVHDIMDPLDVTVPDLDEDDYLGFGEVRPYALEVYQRRCIRGDV